MKAIRNRVLLAASLLAVAVVGRSADIIGLGQEPEFLPVHDAFVLSTELDSDGALLARWEIAEGYYLYRHRFGFKAGDEAGGRLGEPEMPPGKIKVDEFFGEVEVYYHNANSRVPVAAGDGPLQVGIGYQGCADAGFCYPPQTQWVSLDSVTGAVTYLVSKKRENSLTSPDTTL